MHASLKLFLYTGMDLGSNVSSPSNSSWLPHFTGLSPPPAPSDGNSSGAPPPPPLPPPPAATGPPRSGCGRRRRRNRRRYRPYTRDPTVSFSQGLLYSAHQMLYADFKLQQLYMLLFAFLYILAYMVLGVCVICVI